MCSALHILKLDFNGELRSRQIKKPIVPLVSFEPIYELQLARSYYQRKAKPVLACMMKMDLWIAAELS